MEHQGCWAALSGGAASTLGTGSVVLISCGFSSVSHLGTDPSRVESMRGYEHGYVRLRFDVYALFTSGENGKLRNSTKFGVGDNCKRPCDGAETAADWEESPLRGLPVESVLFGIPEAFSGNLWVVPLDHPHLFQSRLLGSDDTRGLQTG